LQDQNAPWQGFNYKHMWLWILKSLPFSLLKALYLQKHWSYFCFGCTPVFIATALCNPNGLNWKKKRLLQNCIMRILCPVR
jgi:hypothetical protein